MNLYYIITRIYLTIFNSFEMYLFQYGLFHRKLLLILFFIYYFIFFLLFIIFYMLTSKLLTCKEEIFFI